jgi:hypothetical protein
LLATVRYSSLLQFIWNPNAFLVAKGGKIISVACSGVKVRPSSPGAVYPPVVGSPDPTSFHIQFDLVGGGKFVFDVTQIQHILNGDPPIYDRWTGSLKGGIVGQTTYTGGVALYEQFTISGLF